MIIYSNGFEFGQSSKYCECSNDIDLNSLENHKYELICGHDEIEDVLFEIKELGVYQVSFDNNRWKLDKLV